MENREQDNIGKSQGKISPSMPFDTAIENLATITHYALKQYLQEPDEFKRTIFLNRINYLNAMGAKKNVEDLFDAFLRYDVLIYASKPISAAKPFYDAIDLARKCGLHNLAEKYVIEMDKESAKRG